MAITLNNLLEYYKCSKELSYMSHKQAQAIPGQCKNLQIK